MVLAETESQIGRFPQPPIMTPSQYVDKEVAKVLGCEDVYEKYAFNKIFTEVLDA